MKITLELGRDEELRQEVLNMIRVEVRNITGLEIRELVKEHINEQNIPARVVAAFKDLVVREIEQFKNGYGRMSAEDIIKAKFEEVVQQRFEAFFKQQCVPFLANYVKTRLEGLSGPINLVKGLLAKEE